MNDNDLSLARRAVACKKWRPVCGMRLYSPFFQVYYRVVGSKYEHSLVLDATGIGAPAVRYRDLPDRSKDPVPSIGTPLFDTADDLLPDPKDAPTIGCMLKLTREAWQDDGLHVEAAWVDGRFVWSVKGGHHHGGAFKRHVLERRYLSEFEALVAAQEAAAR